MATLLEVYNLLHGSDTAELKSRVEASVLQSANYIQIEDPGTTNHAARLAWSSYILTSLSNLQAKTEQMFLGVISDGNIQDLGNAATDTQINTSVAALINTYAV
jgi:hypothetical protein